MQRHPENSVEFGVAIYDRRSESCKQVFLAGSEILRGAYSQRVSGRDSSGKRRSDLKVQEMSMKQYRLPFTTLSRVQGDFSSHI